MVTVALSKKGSGENRLWLILSLAFRGFTQKKKEKENPPVVSPKGRERWKNTNRDGKC